MEINLLNKDKMHGGITADDGKKKEKKGFFGLGITKKLKTHSHPDPVDGPPDAISHDRKVLSAANCAASPGAPERTINAAPADDNGRETAPDAPNAPGRKRALSPLAMVLAVVIIFGGAGSYAFIEFRDGMNVKFTRQSKASGWKADPAEAVGGIRFGAERPSGAAHETGIPSDPAPTDDHITAKTRAVPPSSSDGIKPVPSPAQDRENDKTVVGSVTPGRIERETGKSHLAATVNSPGIPASPPNPFPSNQKENVPAAASPVPVNGKLPVPIRLALSDEAPFRSRFEKRYADKMAAQNPKNRSPGAAPGVSDKVDIRDLIGGDGKPVAPGIAPGTLDADAIAPSVTYPGKISLYGVMVAGDKKVAVTSRGEVRVGGMLSGERIIDITPDGVKLKSGRVLQVASD